MIERKKTGSIWKKIAIVFVVLLIIICVVKVGMSFYYKERWYPNTYVNGIDVSGMKIESVERLFEQYVSDYQLEVTGRDGATLLIKSQDISLECDFSEKLASIYEKEKSGWMVSNFGKVEYEEEFPVSFDKNKMKQIIKASDMVTGKNGFSLIKPENAYVAYNEELGYGEIVKEKQGNILNIDKAIETITHAVEHMETKLDLSEKTYNEVYKQPKYTDEDEKIQKQLNLYNTYLLNWISWDMGEDTIETMTPEDIKDWVFVNKKGKVKLNKEAMSEWVEQFCLKYKTVGTTRDFITHDKQTIKVAGGDYGWRLNYEATVKQTAKAIKNKKDIEIVKQYTSEPTEENKKLLSVELKPKYVSTGFQKDYVSFQHDWDTENYSEVDITDQMVYVFRDGKQVYSSICVTGLDTDDERRTRTGCYYIKDKKEEYVLTGEDYETPSKYWVRIMWTGTGYHYLNRSDWGRWTPEIYKTRGSHGCINLQLEDAKNIFELVRMKDPVFIHY